MVKKITYAVARFAFCLPAEEEVWNYYTDDQEEECNPENSLGEKEVELKLWISPRYLK